MTPIPTRMPSRGEIWLTHMPTDPAGKGKRPVIVVSPNGRNHNPRSNAILVVPLSTSIQTPRPCNLLLRSGETGLAEDSVAQADNIATIPRDWLSEPRGRLRTLTHTKICELAKLVQFGMGCTS